MTATTNAVTPLDVSAAQRLVRLLGMLGSAHDGEVTAAGHGRSPHSRALEWRQLTAWIKRNFADQLSPREYQFIVHLAAWRSMPSPKQQAWLEAIAERFGERLP